MKSPILGGHGQARSLNLADNIAVNVFPVVVETKDGREVGAFYMAPGTDLLATMGSGPIRGTRVVGGTLYVVSGNQVYSVSTSFAATLIGSISTATSPVTIIDNGPLGQIAVFDGVGGYLIKAGVLTRIALPFAGPLQACYQDNFGIVMAANTQQWFQSAPGDLSIWSALAFSSADGSSDNITAITSLHREIWVFKEHHTEVWVDAGLANFAFQRLEGVFLEQGCVATYSVANDVEALYWLGATEQGQGRVIQCRGYAAQVISTQAMETEIATYAKISDATAFCYQQEGHAFYVLNFPTANTTWVYSITSMLWHKRAAFANGALSRHASNCYSFFAGRCVVGDWQSGNLYAFNLDNPTDNGAQRKWVRSWRALPVKNLKPTRFNSLTIDMETGMQVPDGTAPELMLRWSDDGGHNWSSQVFKEAGRTGETGLRVKFNRLGSTRKNSGMDRIFELSSTDPFKISIMGAEVL